MLVFADERVMQIFFSSAKNGSHAPLREPSRDGKACGTAKCHCAIISDHAKHWRKKLLYATIL
jgi:hypothetical protein